MTNIIIKADSSNQIGTGHLIRSNNIAAELKEKTNIYLLYYNFDGNISNKFKNCLKKFNLSTINNFAKNKKDINELSNKFFQEDCNIIKKFIDEYKIDFIIIDNYFYPKSWYKTLYRACKIVTITDFLRRFKHSDLIVNQNCYKKKQIKNYSPKKYLIGPKYSLVANEYFKIKKKIKNNDKLNFFLFFGGIDSDKNTEFFLDTLISIKNKKIIFNVLLGHSNPAKSYYLKKYKNKKKMIKFHVGIKAHKVSKLLNESTHVIVSGGSIVWEVLAKKIKPYVVVTAQNQLRNCKYLENKKLINILRFHKNKLKEKISNIIKDEFKQHTNNQIVNKNGKKLIAKIILKLI